MRPPQLRPIAAATWQELGRLVQSRLERRFSEESVDRLETWGAAGLQRGAHSLATSAHTATNPDANTVGIVTGFCVTAADPPAAETDGPPGALLLAGVLRALGVKVVLISDCYGVPLLRAGAEHCQLTDVEIAECPIGNGNSDDGNSDDGGLDDDAQRWCEAFLRDGPGRDITHLVAIERAGPSHTVASIRQQTTADTTVGRFVETVPAADHGRYHNMRGDVIDHLTAPLDRLFEAITAERLSITTIGIGDGGNEIGFGALPWKLLNDLGDANSAGRANLLARVACRVATDHTIVAGVSNWGGFALALAVAAMRGLKAAEVADVVAPQRGLVEKLVTAAGAVDGFSGRCEPLVDGLDREAHLSPLWQMHDLLFTAD